MWLGSSCMQFYVVHPFVIKSNENCPPDLSECSVKKKGSRGHFEAPKELKFDSIYL